MTRTFSSIEASKHIDEAYPGVFFDLEFIKKPMMSSRYQEIKEKVQK